MIKYYAVDYTKDEKITGKGKFFECEITNSEYLNFLEQYSRDMLKNHFEMFKVAKDYEKIPNNIKGNVNKKKKIVDVYFNTAFLFGQRLIISSKIKSVFEDLKISKSEYFLREIFITNLNIKYYLLLAPKLNISEYNLDYEKSIFFHRDKYLKKKFSSWKELIKESDYYNYDLEIGYISKSLIYKDILSLRITPQVYFSERLMNALTKANILGLDVYDNRVLFVEED